MRTKLREGAWGVCKSLGEKSPQFNYFTHNSLTEIIILFILLALHMNMQIYELKFYLLIHFSAFEIFMSYSKIKQVIIYSEK